MPLPAQVFTDDTVVVRQAISQASSWLANDPARQVSVACNVPPGVSGPAMPMLNAWVDGIDAVKAAHPTWPPPTMYLAFTGDNTMPTQPTEVEAETFRQGVQSFVTAVKAVRNGAQQLRNCSLQTLCTYDGPSMIDPTLLPNTNGVNDPFDFFLPLETKLGESTMHMTREQREQYVRDVKSLLLGITAISAYLALMFGVNSPGSGGFDLIIPILPDV